MWAEYLVVSLHETTEMKDLPHHPPLNFTQKLIIAKIKTLKLRKRRTLAVYVTKFNELHLDESTTRTSTAKTQE
jgi:hypothetical protein